MNGQLKVMCDVWLEKVTNNTTEIYIILIGIAFCNINMFLCIFCMSVVIFQLCKERICGNKNSGTNLAKPQSYFFSAVEVVFNMPILIACFQC